MHSTRRGEIFWKGKEKRGQMFLGEGTHLRGGGMSAPTRGITKTTVNEVRHEEEGRGKRDKYRGGGGSSTNLPRMSEENPER